MVAISLYRGNLHRVSDAPRRWLMPEPQISLRDFKSLLARRSRALARLHSSNSNPSPSPSPISEKLERAPKEENRGASTPESEKVAADCGGGSAGERADEEDSKPDVSAEKPIEEAVSLPDPKPEANEEGSDPVDNGAKPEAMEVGKDEELANPNSESGKREELSDEKRKRKKEVEEKLKVLNEKKHGLVQLLKQVLNTEEELKMRISMQGMAGRPPAPLQVDTTNDSVSMTRHLTPRMGSEPNISGDGEGGDGDALLNQNPLSRQIFRMNSTSPSSESPLRRPLYLQHNSSLHPTARGSLGATGSPSRFTPIGHLGSLPTVSVTGTNYIPSSPSPAASGGTSAFRDTRLPSPWN